MRRVVVTGLGMVTPLGCGVEASWANILSGKSGAGRIEGAAQGRRFHHLRHGGGEAGARRCRLASLDR
jgi:3-oxoacyl-(acyl-carrier-protein) synthase